jgi:hypothetical protein
MATTVWSVIRYNATCSEYEIYILYLYVIIILLLDIDPFSRPISSRQWIFAYLFFFFLNEFIRVRVLAIGLSMKGCMDVLRVA